MPLVSSPTGSPEALSVKCDSTFQSNFAARRISTWAHHSKTWRQSVNTSARLPCCRYVDFMQILPLNKLRRSMKSPPFSPSGRLVEVCKGAEVSIDGVSRGSPKRKEATTLRKHNDDDDQLLPWSLLRVRRALDYQNQCETNRVRYSKSGRFERATRRKRKRRRLVARVQCAVANQCLVSLRRVPLQTSLQFIQQFAFEECASNLKEFAKVQIDKHNQQVVWLCRQDNKVCFSKRYRYKFKQN